MPKLLVLSFTASPPYSAFLPTSDFPANSATFAATPCETSFGDRGGAPAVPSTSGTPFCWTAVSKMRPPLDWFPPWIAASKTANGFFAVTATASARCAVSSGPEPLTNSYSTLRPQVSNACAYTASASMIVSRWFENAPVPWFL